MRPASKDSPNMPLPRHASHDAIRTRLLHWAGIDLPSMPHNTMTYKELRETRWVPDFEKMMRKCLKKIMPGFKAQGTFWSDEAETYMRNRLMMGALRYGAWESDTSKEYCYVTTLQDRITWYMETGNTEHLIDLMNYCLIEFRTNHPHMSDKDPLVYRHLTFDECIMAYRDSKDAFFLVLIACRTMVTFEFGKHPKKHFSSEDDGRHARKREDLDLA